MKVKLESQPHRAEGWRPLSRFSKANLARVDLAMAWILAGSVSSASMERVSETPPSP